MSDAELEDMPQGDDINPYELLQVDREATADQIKSAYRKQALKTHPGKHSGHGSYPGNLLLTEFP